jgi:hypothetical protein
MQITTAKAKRNPTANKYSVSSTKEISHLKVSSVRLTRFLNQGIVREEQEECPQQGTFEK